ncbi:gamma-glutamyltransferase [Nocardioides antri]|uniref:Glutathione hydrolase proenzyme n=1 Tax=Nocardioides antri TaxID=2607659 RepID=A0A5B1LZH5_9ACTN|nr:gamma-glutamyltransferase [Nocardioides antri]KAA1425846.1 gamma-glutamyltransferase [Nocardioides antri]
MPRPTALVASFALALALLGTSPGLDGAGAAPQPSADRSGAPPKAPTAVGRGGAVSSVDPYASRIGRNVLARGGNAVDAAVATAAALGVTEPYSAGIGGGGYFVFYNAKTGKVSTIDGRETAPAAMQPDAFIDPATGQPYPFSPDLVTSGVSVGVPGTPATWAKALRRWGSLSLRSALKPAARLARDGFVVDKTFRLQTKENAHRFRTFEPTFDLFLDDGLPVVGSLFRNPDLARTYERLGRRGTDWFYDGRLAAQIAATVQEPPLSGRTDLPAPPGSMTKADLADYRALLQAPTRVGYRGYDVYGMAPSSSGGTTVGESLNILEQFDLGAMPRRDVLHHYLEASALAFADRGEYVGDPAYVDVPTEHLLDDTFAKERACLIDPDTAATKPVPPGDVSSYDGVCGTAADGVAEPDTEGRSTTHLTTADRWGNVVAYTLTIEQTGGSGIVVPDRGFILNNELTDFSTVYDEDDPNRIQPGKRPRSSMSPTIVLRDGKPVLALGSPGGSTIITTVLQVLVNRLDLGMRLPRAVAAPRATQRNREAVTAEQAFIDRWGAVLEGYGHELVVAGPPGTSAAEIGAVAAIELGPRLRMTAVAEPTRRGGGSAYVVTPTYP